MRPPVPLTGGGHKRPNTTKSRTYRRQNSTRLSLPEIYVCKSLKVLLLNKICLVVCSLRSKTTKVTVRPDFTGTVPNFDGLSRENYEVPRDAELSGIPNAVPILSRFDCNVTSHTYIGLIPIPNSLSSDACGLDSASDPAGGSFTTLPRPILPKQPGSL